MNVTYEDDDLVDSVDKFWGEVPLDGGHDKLSCGGFHRSFTHIIEVRSTQVRSHDNDRVPEVHDSSLNEDMSVLLQKQGNKEFADLSISQPTIV